MLGIRYIKYVENKQLDIRLSLLTPQDYIPIILANFTDETC
jgi:hypothetical protein